MNFDAVFLIDGGIDPDLVINHSKNAPSKDVILSSVMGTCLYRMVYIFLPMKLIVGLTSPLPMGILKGVLQNRVPSTKGDTNARSLPT